MYLDLRHVSGKLEVLCTCLPVVGQLSCVSKERDAFRILVGYPFGNHLLELRSQWEAVKIDLTEVIQSHI